MPQRNLAAEKHAIDVFAKTKGKLPSAQADWADVHKMAYPTMNDLPDELKATSGAYYPVPGAKPATAAPGATPAPSAAVANPLPQNSSNIGSLQANVDQARAGVEQVSSPNMALNVLQEAIKAKTNTAGASIGTSKIFEQAGVGGFGALSQSLNARGVELANDAAQFNNTIDKMSGTYKDMASAAQFRYQAAVDEYNKEVSRVQKIMDDAQDYKRQVEIIKTQHDLQMELEAYKRKNPDIGDQINILNSGYELGDNGSLTDPSKGIVGGFNIGRYATDPNHERAVASILQGIGKFEKIEDVDSYIKRKYPNSPVTGDMISKTSEKYGVPWEMLVAMMEQDSSLGTAGKGAKTFNPGNVGNDDAGNIRNYGTWQAGVDAVGNWLSKNRVKDTSGGSNKFTPAFYATKQGEVIRNDEMSARKNFEATPEVKEFKEARDKSKQVNDLIDSGLGGPADLALVFDFMKALDPNSVVRENEQEQALNSGNIFTGAMAQFNGFFKPSGGKLPENVKEAFRQIVAQKYQAKLKNYQQYAASGRKIAEEQGLNPDHVVIDFNQSNSEQPDAGQQEPEQPKPQAVNKEALAGLNMKM